MENKSSKQEAGQRMTVFVFGSNLAGIHGAGAALYAEQRCGAIRGRGKGLNGGSYAIPTKNQYIQSLTLGQVRDYVIEFIRFATDNPKYTFKVTQIGCGLAGFTTDEIAPLFKAAPSNCMFDTQWQRILGNNKKYWGTFK